MRLALLSPIRLYRDGLADLLSETVDFEIALVGDPAAVSSADLRSAAPRLIVLEIGRETRRSCAASLHSICPHADLVGFAVREIPEDIVACAEAGLAAFVPADSNADDLLRVLRGVLAGELVCSARSAAILYGQLRQNTCASAPVRLLTFRQREVYELLCRGNTNKEIASELNIQLATVKNHVHQILEKLDAQSRTEAARHHNAAFFEA